MQYRFFLFTRRVIRARVYLLTSSTSIKTSLPGSVEIVKMYVTHHCYIATADQHYDEMAREMVTLYGIFCTVNSMLYYHR